MKQSRSVLFLLFIILIVPSTLPAGEQPDDNQKIAAAERFVDLMSQGQYETAVKNFDAAMTAAIPAAALEQAWASLQNQAGEFQKRISTRTQPYQQDIFVIVTCQFELVKLDIKVVIGPDGKLTGLWFLPHTPPAEYAPPPYADKNAFTETDITVGEGKWELPGTLSLPNSDGPFPAVVLVHGSGPQDRNVTIGPNRPFCDLAWGLASRGIAVLRYDKRTLVHSEKCVAELDSLTVWPETIEDALLAADLLRRTEKIDKYRLYIIGHSLGGMLIPRLAAHDRELAGFVVMAGPARPMEDLILAQMEYLYMLDEDLTEDEKEQLNRLQVQTGRVKEPALSRSTPARDLPLNLTAGYWLDLRGYSPPEAAREMSRPLLVLQGERDYQVTMTDFLMWKRILAGRENARFISYPRLNHLFIPGDGKGSPDEYNQPGHVDEQVIKDISDWILGR